MDTGIYAHFINYFRSRGFEPTHRDCEVFADLAKGFVKDSIVALGDQSGVEVHPKDVIKEHLEMMMVGGKSEAYESTDNLEATLFDIATGDAVNVRVANELKDAGYIESLDIKSGWEVFAKLTPKGDKVVRQKLLSIEDSPSKNTSPKETAGESGGTETRTVTASVDGFRRCIVMEANDLFEAIEGSLDDLYDDTAEDIKNKFNAVGCGLNSFNCYHTDAIDGFSNMEDAEEVKLFD
ncbi:hypothetical protein [Vibrio crassostreae]|uniref:hypothetical protein n=1 Tax=Vibrio crassostreae TaxID=246167 RepID=UPI001B316F3C|nr:hypothetical protein [Vibrio crassostreae]